jgi:hypothetical protein
MFRSKNEFRSKEFRSKEFRSYEFRSNEFRSKNEFRSLVDLSSKLNKLSHNCLSRDLASVRVFGRVSCLECILCHMPGRTTRKCKETLLQVKERLTREQENRTRNRIKELLNYRESDSDSDSEEEQSRSTNEHTDSLSKLRRDLYLGLLCLLFLIVLLAYWISSISQRDFY